MPHPYPITDDAHVVLPPLQRAAYGTVHRAGDGRADDAAPRASLPREGRSMRVLIVEDNAGIAGNLYDFLESHGHVVEAVGDGLAGLGAASTGDFDAIILDIRLPRLSGIELCRRLRTEYRCETPVLMLTALDGLDDKLEGFSAGADDYLIKPFAMREVEARLNAVVARRAGRVTRRPLEFGELRYDPESMTVSLSGRPVHLPPKCVRMLAAMMESPNRVFTHAELERIGWGSGETSSETLRAHMSILRRALGTASRECPIRTVHGVGYRLGGGEG
jgi:DNA-binding response OmpR family regulator